MKIYGISDNLYNYKIELFEVEKETEKQYIVIKDNDRFFNSRYTIKKENMNNCHYHFVLTNKEAIEWRKQCIKSEIKANETKIQNLEDRNVDLNNWLDALEE